MKDFKQKYILKPTDILDFGKHSGCLLSEVYKFQPTPISVGAVTDPFHKF